MSKEAGAKILVGGQRGEGLFYEPTVISEVPAGKVVCNVREEGRWYSGRDATYTH